MWIKSEQVKQSAVQAWLIRSFSFPTPNVEGRPPIVQLLQLTPPSNEDCWWSFDEENLQRWYKQYTKRLWHRCFPVNFVKFLRTPVLWNASGDCFCLFYKIFLLICLIMLRSFDFFFGAGSVQEIMGARFDLPTSTAVKL